LPFCGESNYGESLRYLSVFKVPPGAF